MKNILTLTAAVLCLALVACSSDDVLEAGGVDAGYDGTSAIIPSIEFEDMSRSSLVIDGGKMKFSWNDGDMIAVYPVYKEGTDQGFEDGENPRWVLEFLAGSARDNEENMIGSFGEDGEKVKLFTKNTTEYYGWSPFVVSPVEMTAPEILNRPIKVTYLGQTQAQNVEIGYKGGDDNALYLASEANASAHLGKYDYLYAKATQAPSGYTLFDFKHLQATVRFYMEVPQPETMQVFDSIMVLHNFATNSEERKFTTKGEFDLATQTFNYIEQPRTVTLKFGEEGFDLRDYDASTDTYSTTYSDKYKLKSNGKYYIIAYMQMYPVNMIHDDILLPTLYLLGHKMVDGEKVRTYYKAKLTKKNLLAGKAYQWTTTPDEEQPITFEVLTVQQWEEETGFTNGDEGKGTQNW